jgi:hypothetical protein
MPRRQFMCLRRRCISDWGVVGVVLGTVTGTRIMAIMVITTGMAGAVMVMVGAVMAATAGTDKCAQRLPCRESGLGADTIVKI